MAAIGAILTIVIIGIIYWVFSQMDSKNADKFVDRHVKKTTVDIELQKLKTQEEELRLKKEFFAFQKAQLLGQDGNRPVNASYKVKDEIEDKRRSSN